MRKHLILIAPIFAFFLLLSGGCSSNLLKYIDFLSILGGVPVFSLPIENFNDSIFFANSIDGLSPILPAGYESRPILIIPLKKVPVVNTIDLHNIFFEFSINLHYIPYKAAACVCDFNLSGR